MRGYTLLGEYVPLEPWQEEAVRKLLAGEGYTPVQQPGGSGSSPAGHPYSALGLILSTAAAYENWWVRGTPLGGDPRLEAQDEHA